MQGAQGRVVLYVRQPAVPLNDRLVEPGECLVGLAAPGEDLRDAVGRVVGVVAQELLKGQLGLGRMPHLVLGQGAPDQAHRLDLNDQYVYQARSRGCRVSIDTDSHAAVHLDNMRLG
jgi:hypothetical protein